MQVTQHFTQNLEERYWPLLTLVRLWYMASKVLLSSVGFHRTLKNKWDKQKQWRKLLPPTDKAGILLCGVWGIQSLPKTPGGMRVRADQCSTPSTGWPGTHSAPQDMGGLPTSLCQLLCEWIGSVVHFICFTFKVFSMQACVWLQ